MRMKMDREFYIPKAEGMETVTRDGIDATVYVYEVKGRPHACMFGGKRSKPDSHYYYRSVEARDKAVEDYFDGIQASADRKAAYKAKQKAEKEKAVESIKVGDIFVGSWGYDQTNVEFYQVVEKKGVTCKIQKIGQKVVEETQGCDYVRPNPEVKCGKPVTKRINGSGGFTCDVFRLYPDEGNPRYQTAYGYGH
tara:strand:- start:1605 stop:2186 length:582 start_codon:yes stop_codon:yes gene_type:complete